MDSHGNINVQQSLLQVIHSARFYLNSFKYNKIFQGTSFEQIEPTTNQDHAKPKLMQRETNLRQDGLLMLESKNTFKKVIIWNEALKMIWLSFLGTQRMVDQFIGFMKIMSASRAVAKRHINVAKMSLREMFAKLILSMRIPDLIKM